MNDSTMNQLVVDLSQDLVVELAPQEMPVFRACSRIYLEDPKAALRTRDGKDEKLGFGADSELALYTPVILLAMQQVVLFIGGIIASAMAKQGKDMAYEAIKKYFKKDNPTGEGQGLTTAEARRIHEIVMQEARSGGLSETRSKQLADSVVSGLIVG